VLCTLACQLYALEAEIYVVCKRINAVGDAAVTCVVFADCSICKQAGGINRCRGHGRRAVEA